MCDKNVALQISPTDKSYTNNSSQYIIAYRPPISVALGLSPLRYSQTTSSALCTPSTPPETDSKTTDIPDDGNLEENLLCKNRVFH